MRMLEMGNIITISAKNPRRGEYIQTETGLPGGEEKGQPKRDVGLWIDTRLRTNDAGQEGMELVKNMSRASNSAAEISIDN